MSNSSALIDAPLGPTMLKLAVPGVIGALLTSLPGLFEAAFLKEAGAEALAAAALVYPLVILSGMFSAGAFGGAVSGFIARALGSGDAEEASALVCAVLISLVGGVLMWLLVVLFGPFLYQSATDNATVIESARYYAALLFPIIPAYWLINMLSSVLRGSGDMRRPAVVAASLLGSYILLAWLLIPLAGSPTIVAIEGAASAMAGLRACGGLGGLFCCASQSANSFSPYRVSFRFVGTHSAGTVGGPAIRHDHRLCHGNDVIFSAYGTDWLAGFGLAVRLELIMVPVIFGIGASMIAIVGAYVGAGRRAGSHCYAWRGVLVNVTLIGTLGVILAVFPDTWCAMVGSDPAVIGSCGQALTVVAPTYAFCPGPELLLGESGAEHIIFSGAGALCPAAYRVYRPVLDWRRDVD